MVTCSQEKLLSTGHFSKEFFTSRGLEHSDTYRAEVIYPLEDRASCDMASAVEDTPSLVKLTDIVIYELAKDIDIEALGT